jgi:flagellar assembly protein FliH
LSNSIACPGRVIYGLHSRDGVGLNRPASLIWNNETEDHYMEQVRQRAQQMAKEILAQALAEAEAIRATARAEGFAAGRKEAQSLAQEEASKVTALMGTLQSAMVAEKERIYSQHKQSLFQILRLAFEKTLGVMLDEQREQVLVTLFEEAVAQLQARTCITVHVCQADYDLAMTLAGQTRERRGDLPELRISACEDLKPGGVRVESGDGLVDNSIAARFEQVRAILEGYVENS